MPVVPLPNGHQPVHDAHLRVMAYLLTHHNLSCCIVSQVFMHLPQLAVRLCVSAFNDLDDVALLAAAVWRIRNHYSTLPLPQNCDGLRRSMPDMIAGGVSV